MKFYIFNNSIPSEKGMSGSDRRALQYTGYFIKNGHKVTLILPGIGLKRFEGAKADFIVSDNSLFSVKASLNLIVKRLSRGKKICRSLNLNNGDVIYSSSDLLSDSLPAIVLKKRYKGNKFICGLHLIAPNPFKGFRNIYTGKLQLPGLRDLYYYFSQSYVISKLKKFSDLVLVSNHTDKKVLLAKGFREDQVLVTYGAADNEAINQANPEARKYDAVFIGRFHEQKGFVDLIRAVKIVLAKKKYLKLALISDIGERELSGILKSNALRQNIIFFGFKDGREKFKILKESSLLLFPSYYESFGMVIVEAMACGVPVIAYDLPVYKEIYTGGMIKVAIGDVAAFAEQIVYLLENIPVRDRLSDQALLCSKKFSWEKSAEDIIKRVG